MVKMGILKGAGLVLGCLVIFYYVLMAYNKVHGILVDDDYGGEKKELVEDKGGVPKCEVIQIAIMCGGYNSTSTTMVTLIKSILFYRHHPVHFHFITDQPSKKVMETLFEAFIRFPSKYANFVTELLSISDMVATTS